MSRSLRLRFGICSAPAGEYARSRRHAHARANRDLPFGAEDHVDARAKLDQTDALADPHLVSGVLAEHNTARDEAGNLLEDDASAIAIYGDHVLLILAGGILL